MVIMETLQSWVTLLVLLTIVALGTRILGDFMLRLDAEPAAEPVDEELYLIPELPQRAPLIPAGQE